MKQMAFILLLILAVAWAGAGCQPGGGTTDSVPSTNPATLPSTGEPDVTQSLAPSGIGHGEESISIIMDQKEGASITNAEGQGLTFKDTQFEGDLPLLNKNNLSFDNAWIELEIGYSNRIVVQYPDGQGDIMLTCKDLLMDASGSGMSKVQIDFIDLACSVEGTDADYTLQISTGLEKYYRCGFEVRGVGFFQLTDDGIEVRAAVSRIELNRGTQSVELEVPQTEHFLLRPHDDGTAEITALEEP